MKSMVLLYALLVGLGLGLVMYGAGGLRAASLTKSMFSCPLGSLYPQNGSPIVWIARHPPQGLTCQPGTAVVNILSGKVINADVISVHGSDFYHSPQSSDANDTRHFISKDPAFSFDYPEFEGWKTEVSDQNIQWLENESSVQQGELVDIPILVVSWNQMFIKMSPEAWSEWQAKNPKNAKGIQYEDQGRGNILFRSKGGFVSVATPREARVGAFDGELVYQTILNSFSEDISTPATQSQASNQSPVRAQGEVNDIALSCKAQVKGDALEISYVVTNKSNADIYVMDATPARDPTRNAMTDPNSVVVWLSDDGVAHILKGIAELPPDRDVLVSVIPLAPKLRPGAQLERSLKVSLPLIEQSPYYAVEPLSNYLAVYGAGHPLAFTVEFLRSTVEGFAANESSYAPGLYDVRGKNTFGQTERVSCTLPVQSVPVLKRTDNYPRPQKSI